MIKTPNVTRFLPLKRSKKALETLVYSKTTFSSDVFNRFRRQVRESLLISCGNPFYVDTPLTYDRTIQYL